MYDKHYICESEFNTEDINHLGYSLTEIDIYQWIPIQSQNKHGLPNHRLKIWKNLSSGEYEVVMDLMEELNNLFTYFGDKQLALVVENNFSGTSYVCEKSNDLEKICNFVNQMRNDLWNVSRKEMFESILGNSYNLIISKEENEQLKEEKTENNFLPFAVCKHNFPERSSFCKNRKLFIED